MEEIIHVSSESNQTSSLTDYTESVVKCFDSVPEVAKPLIGSAGRLFNRIEKTLYSAPAFVIACESSGDSLTLPSETVETIFFVSGLMRFAISEPSFFVMSFSAPLAIFVFCSSVRIT